MSRIGKLPVVIPEKVDAKIDGNKITVKGPLGELNFEFKSDSVSVVMQDNSLIVTPNTSSDNAFWGTTRSILNNMVEGVVTGFIKSLEINGVGYKFEVQGNKLILSIGYSHKVEMNVPNGLKIEADEKLKNTIHISGIDKQLVGEFSAKIRAKKKPEPYKGKGIKYVGEHIIRKAGKTGSK